MRAQDHPGPGLRRPAALVVSVVLVASAVVASSASSANADPVYPSADQVAGAKQAVTDAAATVSGLEASLAVASSRLEALQTQVQIAAEAYDTAQVELQQRTQAAQAAAASARAAEAAAQKAQDDVGQLAVDSYYDGQGLGGLEVLMGASTPTELLNSAASYRIANSVIEQTFERARASRVVAGVMQRQAAAALAEQQAAAARLEQARQNAQAKASAAQAQTAAIAAERSRMITQLASLRQTSVRLETERQDGIAAERRRRAEAARAAAAKRAAEAAARAAAEKAAADRKAAEQRAEAERRRREREQANQGSSGGSSSGGSSGGSSSGGSGDSGGSGGTPSSGGSGGTSQGSSSAGQAAAAWARTQIGKDYEWGADGPSTYDCSGLTLRAWQRGGVSLPHSSRMQYDVTQHVPYSSLRPGDLIFYGYGSDPSTIHHVGIYIGGGQMVEAPYTGAQVRIASIWRSGMMPFAGRP
ncbi:MAG TPA: C40 family peptidase [Angustibacter sp.]|nr:C40 family peptidase [Angustibacter sp.]